MSKRPPRYADGLLDALVIVAEVSAPLNMADFNETTWKMLCEIHKRLAGAAGDAFEAEAGPR